MHFLKINFGTQWTCSSGQSMIIIITIAFPTAENYPKSQSMKCENIIHNYRSKKVSDTNTVTDTKTDKSTSILEQKICCR